MRRRQISGGWERRLRRLTIESFEGPTSVKAEQWRRMREPSAAEVRWSLRLLVPHGRRTRCVRVSWERRCDPEPGRLLVLYLVTGAAASSIKAFAIAGTLMFFYRAGEILFGNVFRCRGCPVRTYSIPTWALLGLIAALLFTAVSSIIENRRPE